MSLSTLLLSKGADVDNELDGLFKSNPTASNQNAAISDSSKHIVKKRKTLGPSHDSDPKRVKTSSLQSSQRKSKSGAPHSSSDGEKEQSDEDHHHHLPVHESLQKVKKPNRAGAKTKFVPADETAERRDQRTIFIGNLSVEVAQRRPLLKQLQRHILAQIPTAKIESTRFRSIPFQTPTAKLPSPDDGETPSKAKPHTLNQGRAHDRERAFNWREHKDDRKEKEDDAGKSDEKKYLNPNQKKKIAFINQEFHSSADTIHAYIVFAHSLPPEGRPSNLPPPSPTMDPYEAARFAVERCDGTSFMDRLIRVDLVNRKTLVGEKKIPVESSVLDADPKLSVFVGNLDFASKEEDLRVFFEGVVSAERGPPPDTGIDDGDDAMGETNKRPTTWVSRVRIVRDKDTQLGKGFAYVQFTDRGCVDEVLALDQSKLKFAKRKLRVQRCKMLPGSSTSTRHVTAGDKAKTLSQRPVSVPVPIVIPKGDPSLGKKLAHLPKEARKQYKSSDADRVARRLAKKKARIALGNKGVKPLGKDRERVRKDKGVSADKGKGALLKKESKGRVRSEKSLLKRNMKK